MAEGASTSHRVVDAALRCLARTGLRGMTVDDVAVEAGISRATLYRAFPGGRETILGAVVDAELGGLVEAIERATAPHADLRDALVAGLHGAATWLGHHEVVERLMFDEPATLLTHLEFEQMDRTLLVVSERLAPILARLAPAELAPRIGEWVARIAISYLLFPDEADLTDLDDVAWLVDRYVVPGIAAAEAGVRQGETVSTNLS